MQQKPQIPLLIWIAIVALLLMGLISNVIAARNPSARSYPQQVKIVYQPIDYDKINGFIKEQVANIPLAKAGVDGKDGQPGRTGAKGTTGSQGLPGTQGIPGADGKSIQLRYNAAKAQIEYRYDGDITWNGLVTVCTLTNTCGP